MGDHPKRSMMRLHVPMLLILLLGVSRVTWSQNVKDVGGLTEETGCAMAYHMGAVLDVAEKSCEAIKEVSACAHHGKCGGFSELPSMLSAFDEKSPESAWKVCCYHAYEQGGYQTCTKPDSTCKAALHDAVLSYSKQQGIPNLSVKDKASAEAVLPKLHNILNRLQDARAAMWGSSPACKKLANPSPKSNCGWKSKPDSNGQHHSLARNDLYCETIEWQYSEMGAGDAYMKQCPNSKKIYRSPTAQKKWQKDQQDVLKQDGLSLLQDKMAQIADTHPDDDLGDGPAVMPERQRGWAVLQRRRAGRKGA